MKTPIYPENAIKAVLLAGLTVFIIIAIFFVIAFAEEIDNFINTIAK